MDKELRELAKAIDDISEIAKGFGLDYYDMRFEICPAEILYTIGAYGMPTRYSHWSFGKRFHKMKTSYDYNLSKIYELVINSDPCYAFLLEGNSLIQNKLVIAHVYAHCDFFKNNIAFRKTNRQMVSSMASSAERISRYEFKYGRDEVEKFLDSALAIQEHIDPYLYIKKPEIKDRTPKRQTSGEYEDLWSLEEVEESVEIPVKERLGKGTKDILLFIMEHGKGLKPWQKDILTIVREEMLYFWPQLETKIMNEGWASFWHARILRELSLSDSEAIEFAKLHSSVIQPSRSQINPYYLGMMLFEYIEKRWNDPTPEEKERFGRLPNQGREKIFEVREVEKDISFLRNYITTDFVEEMDLYLFKKVGHQWQVTDTMWEQVRDGLVSNLINGGFPVIVVEDGDYHDGGELLLKHCYEGIELDLKYLEKTLQHLYYLWTRPVHLQTVVDNKPVIFSYNGDRNTKKLL